jgi:hypothetical protein
MSDNPISAVAEINTYFLFRLSEMIPAKGLANSAVIENMPTMTPATDIGTPRCIAYLVRSGMTM